jgi:hypothetical protein
MGEMAVMTALGIAQTAKKITPTGGGDNPIPCSAQDGLILALAKAEERPGRPGVA